MSRICSFLSSAVSSAVVKAEDAQGWTKEEECVCVGGRQGLLIHGSSLFHGLSNRSGETQGLLCQIHIPLQPNLCLQGQARIFGFMVGLRLLDSCQKGFAYRQCCRGWMLRNLKQEGTELNPCPVSFLC